MKKIKYILSNHAKYHHLEVAKAFYKKDAIGNERITSNNFEFKGYSEVAINSKTAIFLENSKIVDSGNYDFLLKNNINFEKLVKENSFYKKQ